MTSSILPALLPIGALLGAVLATIASSWRTALARAIALVTLATLLVVSGVGLASALDEGSLVHQVGGWAAPIGIEYVLDPLSGTMAVLVTAMALLVVIYPTRIGFAVEPDRGTPLHAVTLLLVAGLLSVVLAGDLFHLFVGLEIYSIASYSLVALGGARAAVASFRYLILGTMGSSLYLLGVGFLYFLTGGLGMRDVAEQLAPLSGSTTLAAASALIVVGLGIKMAVFPLHVWLPAAHTAAPPGVAALLAAVQVKVAAYALVRVVYDVLPPGYAADELPILTLLTWFGAAGIVVGSIMAIRQTEVKAMLAHSTVAQLGYIAVGIGLATPTALVGALLHVVSHAVMKGCMFFVAGAAIDSAGAKTVAGYAGLGTRMPWTMAGFTVAAISMVGLPPTAGFFSKWYLVLGAGEAGRWPMAVVIGGASLLTLVYVLRLLELIWFRPRAEGAAPVSEASASVLVPVLVLAATVIVVGVGNVALVEHVLEPVARGFIP